MFRKLSVLAVTAVLALGLTAGISYGESSGKKPIKSVSLIIHAEIEPDTDFGGEQIDIDTRSSKYSFNEYELLNEGEGWASDSVPKLKIYLSAGSDYYFSSISKDTVKFKGNKASYVSSSREDGSETLVLIVNLEPLDTVLDEVEDMALEPGGMASWKPEPAAGSYEVRLYCNDSPAGAAVTVFEASYNFASQMTKEGSYTFRIRPIGKRDKKEKGEWAESDPVYLDLAAVEQVKTSDHAQPEGQWMQDAVGWWYRFADGSYPAGQWLELKGKWYFFGGDGYMMTGWIDWDGRQYYCDRESGTMLTNCMTPDSYLVDENGARLE